MIWTRFKIQLRSEHHLVSDIVFGNDALLDDFTIYSLDETTINARWIECAFCWNETIILVIRTIESDWFSGYFASLAWLGLALQRHRTRWRW